MDRRLFNAVIRRVGRQGAKDAARYGADGGFPGFTYYTETVRFFGRWRREILAMVREDAADCGMNPADMVAGFRCLNGAIDIESIYAVLTSGHADSDDEMVMVKNALAWYALEKAGAEVEV